MPNLFCRLQKLQLVYRDVGLTVQVGLSIVCQAVFTMRHLVMNPDSEVVLPDIDCNGVSGLD